GVDYFAEVALNGKGASADLVSRCVAKGASRQSLRLRIYGDALCSGHSECDALLMEKAEVSAIPELVARHPEAHLIHEAAIGKIASEQILKLMTLGLTRQQAEARIIQGFLK
ncbi:MAG: SufD family Fe-S cluster assembly protein, partial [Clostridiales bacterium]|nr:SufD family Fe-S cluster assembly protein [Clostridiales bacterium]